MAGDRRLDQENAINYYPAMETAMPLSSRAPSTNAMRDAKEGDAPNPSSPESRSRRCRACNCHLSRYNGEEYCSCCVRQSSLHSPRQTISPEIWARSDVREALASRNFGRLCQLIREYSCLRQGDISELTGLSQAFLSMLESGNRKLTNIEKIVTLLEGLDVPLELTGPMLRSAGEMASRCRAQYSSPHLQSA